MLDGPVPDQTASNAATSRIPVLDGLRAFAILCVLVAHSSYGLQLNIPASVTALWVSTGGYGVGLFFVLSGFLITRLLLREREATGKIDLRHFYIRRALRILPAFVIYISVVWILRAEGVYSIDRGSMWAATFFYKDYRLHGEGVWPVVHIWTLSLEEQFYLVWPFVVALFGRRGAGRISIALILGMPLFRTLHFFAFPGSRALVASMFHTTADRFAFGTFLACFYEAPWLRSFFQRRIAGVLVLGVLAFAMFVGPVVELTLRGAYTIPFGLTVSSLAMAGLTAWALFNPQSAFGRILSTSLARKIAVISYGLYLWQQLFLSNWHDMPLRLWERFPLNLALAFLCATLSYWLVERRFLNLSQRPASQRPGPRLPIRMSQETTE